MKPQLTLPLIKQIVKRDSIPVKNTKLAEKVKEIRDNHFMSNYNKKHMNINSHLWDQAYSLSSSDEEPDTLQRAKAEEIKDSVDTSCPNKLNFDKRRTLASFNLHKNKEQLFKTSNIETLKDWATARNISSFNANKTLTKIAPKSIKIRRPSISDAKFSTHQASLAQSNLNEKDNLNTDQDEGYQSRRTLIILIYIPNLTYNFELKSKILQLLIFLS